MAEQSLIGHEQKMTPATRYYRLHRDEQLARKKEEYNKKPEIIAKREERERKRAEKESEKEIKKQLEKEAKRIEKAQKIQEKYALAEATRRKLKEKTGDGLDAFLVESYPVSGDFS